MAATGKVQKMTPVYPKLVLHGVFRSVRITLCTTTEDPSQVTDIDALGGIVEEGSDGHRCHLFGGNCGTDNVIVEGDDGIVRILSSDEPFTLNIGSVRRLTVNGVDKTRRFMSLPVQCPPPPASSQPLYDSSGYSGNTMVFNNGPGTTVIGAQGNVTIGSMRVITSNNGSIVASGRLVVSPPSPPPSMFQINNRDVSGLVRDAAANPNTPPDLVLVLANTVTAIDVDADVTHGELYVAGAVLKEVNIGYGVELPSSAPITFRIPNATLRLLGSYQLEPVENMTIQANLIYITTKGTSQITLTDVQCCLLSLDTTGSSRILSAPGAITAKDVRFNSREQSDVVLKFVPGIPLNTVAGFLDKSAFVHLSGNNVLLLSDPPQEYIRLCDSARLMVPTSWRATLRQKGSSVRVYYVSE